MESTINIFELYSKMTDYNIMLIYHGLFDQEMIKSVLTITEKKLEQNNVEENTKRKLFNVMMEGLQNIAKHQQLLEGEQYPFVMIATADNNYSVTTGNYINNNKIQIVKDKIDKINSLDKEALKEFYKQARLNSMISSVGGAGLGFIDMARKSGNKLEYNFYEVDDSNSLFILNTNIINN